MLLNIHVIEKAHLSDKSNKHFEEFYPQNGGENQMA